MKKGIHPDFVESTIKCACGNKVETRSIKEELSVEICSQCHPFFTGEERLLDVAGRVEKFQKKFGSNWKTSVQKRNETIKKTAKSEKTVDTKVEEAEPVKVVEKATPVKAESVDTAKTDSAAESA